MRAVIFLTTLAFAPLAQAQDARCLSTFASRYIGETEKNLERTLDPATPVDVVLSVDEADAIFGDHPHDQHEHADQRFANHDVAPLLLRLHQLDAIENIASERRAVAAGFSRYSGEGIVVVQTESGARVIEFTRATRTGAIAYARASVEACPPARLTRRRRS